MIRDMNRVYSLEAVEPQTGAAAAESFKFVSEAKRDVWREGGEGRSEPSCCLSVRNISYTVR